MENEFRSTQSQLDVLNLESVADNPFCLHGPTVLFSNGKKKFYSCAACRDRKLCTFYHEFNETKAISKEKMNVWREIYDTNWNGTRDKYEEVKAVKKTLNKKDKFSYCQDCQIIVLDSNDSSHDSHYVKSDLEYHTLAKPILEIVQPLELNSANAQFIFDSITIEFVLNYIQSAKYDSVLCIGSPSIFEKLSDLKLNRYLLDIDDRLIQFYDEREFSKYNMFNNHFFQGRENFERFMAASNRLFVLVDPPYGGLVKLIAHTIKQLKDEFGKADFHVFLVYPYFIESWIKKWLPEFNMLDYKVSYSNQKKFAQTSDSLKKGSPARFFTNVPLKEIELPVDQGYKYCSACQKHVFKENAHCDKCNHCTSKDGGLYSHCDMCNKCVKASWIHCSECQFCHLDDNESSCKKKRKPESDSFRGKKKVAK